MQALELREISGMRLSISQHPGTVLSWPTLRVPLGPRTRPSVWEKGW